MSYEVQLTRRAQKQLASLDRKTIRIIASAIDKLAECEDPKNLPNCKKLQGVKNGWRWRVGTYRILGTIDEDRIVIEIFRVGHRKDAHENLSI